VKILFFLNYKNNDTLILIESVLYLVFGSKKIDFEEI